MLAGWHATKKNQDEMRCELEVQKITEDRKILLRCCLGRNL